MKRAVIAGTGAIVALGFLSVSAVANYMFGASLGRTPWEGQLYGGAGVLAVAMNSLAPFYISWSLTEKRRTAAATIAAMWAICLLYSTSSALGFAAQNREGVAVARQLSHDAYEDTRRELFDLEARQRNATRRERARLDSKIDGARKRLTAARNKSPAPADAQSQFLSAITLGFVNASHVRVALVALFALMIEVCATLGLFAALSHSFERPFPTKRSIQLVPDTKTTAPPIPKIW